MPFLAGLCAFSAKGCRKRHPNKEEAEKLIAKYKATKCRYGEHCKTAGCLYIHPTDGADLGGPAAFPPLVGTNGAPRPVAPSGAWKPMQPTGAAVVSPPAQPSRAAAATINGQQPPAADAPVKAAWGSSQPAPVWGKPKNAVLMSHAGSPANGGTVPSPAAAVTPSNGNSPVPKPPMSFAAVAQKQPQPQAPTPQQQSKPPTQPVVESTSLNIHAKEFVPGGGF